MPEQCSAGDTEFVNAATDDDSVLSMWVVYDHPSDYPAHYIARLHEVGTTHQVTDQVLVSATLEPLQEQLAGRGLIRITRNEEDDPVIVETWL